MENNDNNTFSYTYTALSESEKREVARIKERYTADNKSSATKLDRLRSLDAKVRNGAMIIGITLGVVGVLVFGLGLTCVLEWGLWVLGISLMVAGCVPIAVAYPVHNAVYKHNRNKYGDEIARLSEEILNEGN